MVTDIDHRSSAFVVKEIEDSGGLRFDLTQDVTNEGRWAEIASEIESRFWHLDILVSNAGIGINVASIVDMTPADWRRQTAINLDGFSYWSNTVFQ